MPANMDRFISFDPKTRQFICHGDWVLMNVEKLTNELQNFSISSTGQIIINGESITKMDSAGAWAFSKWVLKLIQQGLKTQLQNFSDSNLKILSLVEKAAAQIKTVPQAKQPKWLARIGKLSMEQFSEALNFLTFIGQLTLEALRMLVKPAHIRLNAIAGTIDATGLRALPIIALLSLMIGVVLAYQMGLQLRDYGANIFIADLVGHSILREFGPLITAIMVAGRTGSAFTAQLGTMKINQEIDALNTMGITPAELLLIPRLIGLFIALPLLTIWADIFGVLGGMLMANNMLHVGWYDFLMRFQHQIPLRTLILGLGKAPIFALIIGSIGCFEGMQVAGSADSVGKKTTRSVVWAIFFIIVADALFSILFSKFKL
jgi:phospholipid/cholesterol/gamma-HCH transport system permease protein